MAAPRRKLAQAPVQRGVSRLVVRCVCDRARRGFDAEAQAALGMIQPARGNRVIADPEAFASLQFAKLPARGHGGKVDREIRKRHLRLEYLAERITAQEFRPETVELKFIFLHVKRREEWQSLNMVPVVVRDEDLGIRRAGRGGSAPAANEGAQTGAATRNELCAVRAAEVQARAVSA